MIHRLPSSLRSRLRPRENSISILIVDDTESIVHLLTHFLAGIADKIQVARDGEQAVELVSDASEADEPYDVVLMDLQMPNKSGLQAAKEIRDQGIDVPLIAMTAGGLPAEDCVKAGFNGYVTKPFDRKNLVKFITGFVN
ncbi:response regulator [Neorhodopirellula lusitana]|uniref:response regulator n=1 Tax=Neorhodopirellula lusitana TaxID=445327 RepID=UPI00384CAB7B